jgi:hypothetical protein
LHTAAAYTLAATCHAHDHDITAPMKMYNGAVEIAQGAGVGVLPVTLRYNLPVGLDKMDCPLSNAIQVLLVLVLC